MSDGKTSDDAVLDAPLFRAGAATIMRRHVLRWAQRFDPVFVERSARRAALGALELEDDPSLEADVEAAARQFRYAHDLESSDALIEWLTARGVSVDAWWEAERVNVLERRLAGRALAPGAADDQADADVETAALVVTDLLEFATDAVARRVAVACEVGGDAVLDLTGDALESIWNSWRSEQLTEAALQQAVDRERLSWLVFELVQTGWDTVEAAHEALLCVRDDGMPLDEVARDAHASVQVETRLLMDVPDALHDALLSAAPGALIGPIEQLSRWMVMLVRAKRSPSLRDPLVRAAAARQVDTRAVAPLVNRHVVWPRHKL